MTRPGQIHDDLPGIHDDLPGTLRETQLSREIWRRETAYFKNLYVETDNPLYIWKVMSLYCTYGGRFPLPDWCQEYFAYAADGLFSLSRRQDIRKPNRMNWKDLKSLPSTDAKTALSLVPFALGLSGRQGKSMLLDFNSRLAKGYEISLYENLRANGVGRREATDILLRITKREDERSLRRSFAESETRIGQGKSKAK